MACSTYLLVADLFSVQLHVNLLRQRCPAISDALTALLQAFIHWTTAMLCCLEQLMPNQRRIHMLKW